MRCISRGTRVLVAALAISVAGCRQDEPRPEQVQPPTAALIGVPVMPGIRPMSVSGSSDAVGTNLLSEATPDSVAQWYRRALVEKGWRLIGDLASGDTITLHAQRDGPPLWIIVYPGAGGSGSAMQIVGAVGK